MTVTARPWPSSAVAGVVLAGLASAVLAFLPTQFAGASSGLVNGGFESGDLTGWTLTAAPSGGAGEVVAQYSTGQGSLFYRPAQGLDFAVLTPGQGGTYTELSQLVSVDAGETIHGWAFFRTTEDFSGGGGANDDAEVAIQSGGVDVATPYHIDASTIGTNAHTEWTPWSYTFPAAGTYAVQGRVRNVADSLSPSYLGLDGISFGDTTAPATSITLTPASPDGQNGWYVSNVHATVTASDNPGGSGVAETRCVLDPPSPPTAFDDVPAGCIFTGSGNDVTADGPHTLYAASQDNAGNKETPVNTSLKVDRNPPTLACTSAPTFTLASEGGGVSATVSDATSGPAQSSISAPVSSSDTATPGVKTKSLTGYDNAGNPTTVTCPYLVAYAFRGFYAPVDNPPTVNVGNAGKTYPVKFTLSDAAGNYISSLTSVTGIQYKQVTCGAFTGDPADALETTASGGSALRYDATTNQFIYNWQTPSGQGCYELFVHTGDGVLHQADFQLK